MHPTSQVTCLGVITGSFLYSSLTQITETVSYFFMVSSLGPSDLSFPHCNQGDFRCMTLLFFKTLLKYLGFQILLLSLDPRKIIIQVFSKVLGDGLLDLHVYSCQYIADVAPLVSQWSVSSFRRTSFVGTPPASCEK